MCNFTAQVELLLQLFKISSVSPLAWCNKMAQLTLKGVHREIYFDTMKTVSLTPKTVCDTLCCNFWLNGVH
jgi:hypothetical protein